MADREDGNDGDDAKADARPEGSRLMISSGGGAGFAYIGERGAYLGVGARTRREVQGHGRAVTRAGAEKDGWADAFPSCGGVRPGPGEEGGFRASAGLSPAGRPAALRAMRLFCFSLFLAGSLSLFAQANKVQELEHALADAAPAERSALLIQLAEALEPMNPSAAEAHAAEARKLAPTPAGRLRAEAVLASFQRGRGDYLPALTAARAGLERATALGDDSLRLAFLFVIAQTHWSLTEYPESIATFQQVIALAQRCGESSYVARGEIGIGVVYVQSRQWDLAYPHFERVESLVRTLGDRELLASFLNNLGNCLQGRREFERAEAAHREALELRRAAGNLRGEGDSLLNLGSLATEKGDFAAGLAQGREAIAIYERLAAKRPLVNARTWTALALQKLGRTDEALAQLGLALATAETLGSQALLEKVHRGLAAAHEARGDYQAALESLRRSVAAGEAAANVRTREQISLLNVRFEAERRERELADLRHGQALAAAELARGRLLHYSLAAVLGLTVIAFAAVLSRQRLKLRAERRIVEETRAAHTAAEEANAMKTRLLGVASHDLKGPLRSMIRGAEALAAAPDDRATVERYARLLRGTGEELYTFVGDLIDVAALEAGMLRLDRRLVDVAALAAEVVALHEPRAQEKEQPFSLSVDGGPSHFILADRSRLRQAVDNLVDNAIKFTPVGRPVRVTVSRGDGTVSVEVRDAGPGLKPEDYVRMFQPFQRLSALPTGGESSTGLGLSIVRELVALHGGQLIVNSIPDEGATFRIELPAATAEGAAISGASELHPAAEV